MCITPEESSKMVNDFNFGRIPEIYFGQGKFRLLPTLVRRYGKNVLLISGARSFIESSKYMHLRDLFSEESINHLLVRIAVEPSPLLIDGIVNEYLEKDIDVVVAIGGGSVLDAGKAIASMITQDGYVQEYLEGIGSGKAHAGRRIPFIAVPTTAGTGSETTRNAVLSMVGKSGFKKSLRHQSFTPDIAVVDPVLTVTCPPEITAACGMDAFTQLLESFVSVNSSPVTDSLCLSGLSSVASGLQEAVLHPSNLEARTQMSYAAMVSGITLANAGLGIIHGLASVIGGYFNIPHGVVCGTLAGSATRANIEKLFVSDSDNRAREKYALTGRTMIRASFHSDRQACNELIALIEHMTESFKIPRLGQFGLQLADLDMIIKSTEQKQNPVTLNAQELINILKERV